LLGILRVNTKGEAVMDDQKDFEEIRKRQEIDKIKDEIALLKGQIESMQARIYELNQREYSLMHDLVPGDIVESEGKRFVVESLGYSGPDGRKILKNGDLGKVVQYIGARFTKVTE
jgi:hypothetical protein